ncbi:DNA polymerase III subunit beta [Mycoplasmopsis edwardii]|uniref:DNA polymerase III subunit beta n=1 Tax=Mycoplasmopsis edwardii TaxID=53558 RepID=A0ACD4PIZ9_9BACT|nr:DNA polymerase III subunit beta [Mycoplasmopsis edwardii]WBP84023.1 DNA polymerase III subunit beta [Mycoplasmopsis edwardii]
MKFTISKNLIESTVEFLSSFVDNIDSFLPFRGIYIEIDNNEITFIGGSSSIAAKKTIKIDEKNIKLDQTGRILINTQILKNLIKKFEKEITFIKNDRTLEVFENKTKYTLTLLDETKYPHFNFSVSDTKVKIKSKDFSEALNNAYISSNLGQDKNLSLTTNPVTKFINLKSEDKLLRFTSTDTFRLSTHVIDIETDLNIDVNIDNKNFKKLYNKEMPEFIDLFFGSNKIGISYHETVIFTHTSNIKYIDISKLLEFDKKRFIKIKKDELSKVINKTVFAVADKVKRLELSISEKEIKATFEVPEIGVSEFMTTDFEYTGLSFEMDINWIFLKDAISAFNSEFIYLYINDEGNKIYILEDDNTNNIQLLTPIRKY